jgi:hypothetical protein
MDKELQKAFENTCKVVLGTALGNLEDFRPYLSQGIRLPTPIRSAVSSKAVYLSFFSFFQQAKRAVITLDEFEEEGKRKLTKQEVAELSFPKAKKQLEKIALYTQDVVMGSNLQVTGCSAYGFSAHCADGEAYVHSKYCAYCMWPRESEHSFGCDFLFASSFCIRCFHSARLSRCLEVAYSTDCSDCALCFNCENCSNCLLCFNAKNLRHAVCNVELSKEEYLRIKQLLLASMLSDLKKKKGCEIGIFSQQLSKQ